MHQPTRYELTASGIPHARWEDVDRGPSPPLHTLNLEVRGHYGDPCLVDRLAQRYHVDVDLVVPVPGASAANFAALAAVMGHGDPIALEQPVYDPIRRVARFLGLTVWELPRRPETNFDIDSDDLRRVLMQGVKAVVLTNLHNPSAREFSMREIGETAAACARHGATLMLDEVYLDGAQLSRAEPVQSGFSAGGNVVVTNSLTKVYGLSGLRMGWVIAPRKITDRVREVTNLLHVDHPAPATSVAAQALAQMSDLEVRFRTIWQRGRDVFRDWLANETRVHAYPNDRALFRLLRLPEGLAADRFNALLTRRFDAQVVPGGYFDLPDHVRIGLTLPPAELREALRRVSACLDELA